MRVLADHEFDVVSGGRDGFPAGFLKSFQIKLPSSSNTTGGTTKSSTGPINTVFVDSGVRTLSNGQPQAYAVVNSSSYFPK